MIFFFNFAIFDIRLLFFRWRVEYQQNVILMPELKRELIKFYVVLCNYILLIKYVVRHFYLLGNNIHSSNSLQYVRSLSICFMHLDSPNCLQYSNKKYHSTTFFNCIFKLTM